MRTLIAAGTIALHTIRELVMTEKGERLIRFPSFFDDPERLPAELLAPGDREKREAFETAVAGAVRECSASFEDAGENGWIAELKRRAASRKTFPPLLADPQTAVLLRPGREGFLAALWYLCEICGSGCDADIKKIPVRQETVEICEHYDLDLYEAECEGMVLIAAPDGDALLYELERRGLAAQKIGILTSGKARTLRYAGHTRYLDRPRASLQ